jgi:hypothetical protein
MHLTSYRAGYCLEKKILVYEYLEHGSLEDALISNAPKLAWRQRVRVLLEVSAYLIDTLRLRA